MIMHRKPESERKTKRLHLLITADMEASLKKLSAERQIEVSALVREFLAKAIKNAR